MLFWRAGCREAPGSSPRNPRPYGTRLAKCQSSSEGAHRFDRLFHVVGQRCDERAPFVCDWM